MLRLTVNDGRMVQTLTLGGDKVFLGRLPANTIELAHPSVSRKHCLIRRNAEGGYELLDLNSSHGTHRNGERIERCPIGPGDELTVGEVTIRIESPEGIVAPPPAPPKTKRGLLARFRGNGKAAAPAAPAAAAAASAPAPSAKHLISQGHRTEFSEELYRTVRRTPWWAASLALHSFLLWLLFVVPFAAPAGEDGLGEVTGRIEDDLSSWLADEIPPAEKLRPEPEREREPPNEVPVEEPPVPLDPMLPPDEPETIEIPEIGPTTMDFSVNPPRASPFSSPSVPDVEFDQEGAANANEAAGAILLKSMKGRAGELAGILDQMGDRKILVVNGHYDKVETVLELLHVKHEEVSSRKLELTDLADRRVLILNCTNEKLSRGTLRRVRDFVAEGGYLLTTDWGIENVLKDAFEGYLEPVTDPVMKGRNVSTLNEVIHIHAAPDRRGHFLLAGTSLGEGEAMWWLEESTYPFVVKRPKDVEVLIESTDLKERYGSDAVAATFRFGKGRVLHMLGHFYQKEGNLKGTFSTQRLIANFLVAAVRRR